MSQYKGIRFVPKVNVDNKETLAIVYTPGVSASCLEIKNDKSKSFDYTNRENTVAVLALDYYTALQRCLFLKSTINVDACPFEISINSFKKLDFILANIEPSFGAFDLTCLPKEFTENKQFSVSIPVLSGATQDLKKSFLCVSKNLFMSDLSKLEGNSAFEKSLALRKKAGGVIETELTEGEHIKPVAVLSDGSAVLGLGNIGAEAAMPVMEGKAVLFSSLGGVSAMGLCIKTQKSEEIIELVSLIANSFSGINLEDISAPRCFEIEEALIEKLNIPVFHDDQHGTAIVVLSALLNALALVDKKLSNVKIVFSGAGAAACAVANLLLDSSALNVVMVDIDGIIYQGRSNNTDMHNKILNKSQAKTSKGTLKEALINADVFIGLSAPNVLTEEMIKTMNEKPIIFALANPTPEIMPDKAIDAGAFVVATGRSDFANQVNNSLVFPGLFNALLTHKINKVTQNMKINCAFAIASLVEDKELAPNYIIVDALNVKAPLAILKALA